MRLNLMQRSTWRYPHYPPFLSIKRTDFPFPFTHSPLSGLLALNQSNAHGPGSATATQPHCALRLIESDQQDTKAEILSLLAQAHRHRESRIFQAKTGIPVPLWWALIAFTAMLSLFVSFSGIKYRAAAVVMAACFAAGIAAILVTVRLLDYPFEGALALPPDGFIEVAGKVSNLLNQVSDR